MSAAPLQCVQAQVGTKNRQEKENYRNTEGLQVPRRKHELMRKSPTGEEFWPEQTWPGLEWEFETKSGVTCRKMAQVYRRSHILA